MESTPNLTEAQKVALYCESLVGLFVDILHTDPYDPLYNQWDVEVATGNVIEFKNHWFVVTAGHYFKELNEARADGKIKIERFYFVDYFHNKAPNNQRFPVIYDYDLLRPGYMDDAEKGLDVAILVLGDWLKENLKASGIKPITQAKWQAAEEEIEYDRYLLVGLPAENVKPNTPLDGQLSDLRMQTAVLEITKLNPEEVDNLPVTDWPRFIGRVNLGNVVKSVKGMSGGPIFGFQHDKNEIRYRIAAMQCSWWQDSKIVFGCPINLFLSIFTTMMEKNAVERGLSFDYTHLTFRKAARPLISLFQHRADTSPAHLPACPIRHRRTHRAELRRLASSGKHTSLKQWHASNNGSRGLSTRAKPMPLISQVAATAN